MKATVGKFRNGSAYPWWVRLNGTTVGLFVDESTANRFADTYNVGTYAEGHGDGVRDEYDPAYETGYRDGLVDGKTR